MGGGAAENSDQILKLFYEDSSTSLPLVRPLLIKWFHEFTHISVVCLAFKSRRRAQMTEILPSKIDRITVWTDTDPSAMFDQRLMIPSMYNIHDIIYTTQQID